MVNKRRTNGKMRRRKDVRVALTKRDKLVFRMLEKARVMRTGDFVPLAFPSLGVYPSGDTRRPRIRESLTP